MSYERYIYIGGYNYARMIESCSFSWDSRGGCSTASMSIPKAAFDQFFRIDIDDIVDIRFGSSSSTRWWQGIVTELTTTLDGGLSISATGLNIWLDEAYPTGRFGLLVETEPPTELDSEVDSDGGSLAAGTYTYTVTSIDAAGETLPCTGVPETVTGDANAVTLTWTAAQGATGYRVYRNNTVYWDVSDTTFTDDGNSDGVSGSAPVTATSTVPTIADTKVSDVVEYLLDTFLPSGLTKGDVTAGTETDLDDYDLTGSTASLKSVLYALADIVGDTLVIVDEDAKVHFVPRSTDIEYRHKFGDARGYWLSVSSRDANFIQSASRTITRDGISTVKVDGEETFEDEDQNTGDSTDPREEFQDRLKFTLADTYNISGKYYEDARFHDMSIYIDRGIEIWGSLGAVPLVSPATSDFFLTGGVRKDIPDLENYFYLCPFLYRIWRMYEFTWSYPPTSMLTKWLTEINRRIKQIKIDRALVVDGYDGPSTAKACTRMRPNVLVKTLPGVKTERTAALAAANLMLKYVPNPERWSIVMINNTTLMKPGLGMYRLTTKTGTKYDLNINSVNYSFDENVVATLELGDEDYTVEAEQAEQSRVVKRASARKARVGIWRPHSERY